MQKLIVVLLSLVLFSACGWQLRGAGLTQTEGAKNFNALKLRSENRSSAFYQAFQKVLGRYEIQETNDAELSLDYSTELLERQPMAYGSTGIPIQYQLTMSMDYNVVKKNGEWLLSPRKIIVRRNYDFDADLIIAKDREEQELLREMRDEIANRIIKSIEQAL